MHFELDSDNSIIRIEREFEAALNQVWAAWTESELLDQWWAPLPWKTETKSMEFKVGGTWLYAMVGPENEKHWCKADYKNILPHQSFSYLDAFCDDAGNSNTEFPRMLWELHFESRQLNTLVKIRIKFDSRQDLEKIIELGFKEGFTMALSNLDRIFDLS